MSEFINFRLKTSAKKTLVCYEGETDATKLKDRIFL